MEGADQLQALEEHLNSALVNSRGVIIQLAPVEFGVKRLRLAVICSSVS